MCLLGSRAADKKDVSLITFPSVFSGEAGGLLGDTEPKHFTLLSTPPTPPPLPTSANLTGSPVGGSDAFLASMGLFMHEILSKGRNVGRGVSGGGNEAAEFSLNRPVRR